MQRRYGTFLVFLLTFAATITFCCADSFPKASPATVLSPSRGSIRPDNSCGLGRFAGFFFSFRRRFALRLACSSSNSPSYRLPYPSLATCSRLTSVSSPSLICPVFFIASHCSSISGANPNKNPSRNSLCVHSSSSPSLYVT